MASWLLPPAAVFRFLRRGSNPDDASSDFKYSAGPVNTVGRLLGDLERRVARRRALPFGLSLLATARKA